ncbi:MAG: hypothetical protein WCV81_03355 [Microgenomates group bacterium]|jgi:hypothetical protein
MLERAGQVFDGVFNTIDKGRTKIHDKWAKVNPDIYTATDANYILKHTSEASKKHLFGNTLLNPENNVDRAKIWSLPPEVFESVQGIVEDSGHVHFLPFILGTYNISSSTMRMNDVCLTDPLMAYLAVNGGLDGLSMPFLRGLYHVGRRSWWRHESIHARHHQQMAYFLEAKNQEKSKNKNVNYWGENAWQSEFRLDEAACTIHEAGIEELLTRWQTLKESRGLREKAVSSLALLLFMEYSPFMGTRNMFIDAKEQTADLVNQGWLRVPLKIATAAGILLAPPVLNADTHIVDNVGNAVSHLLPISEGQVTGAVWRGHSYIFASAVGALFSSKEKGAFQQLQESGQRLSTNEYKFPYTYSPVTSTGRAIGFLSYLQNVWDQIPNYRMVESPQQIDLIKREIDDKVAPKMDSRKHQFTMKVVEDALSPVEHSNKSDFPQEVYPKGMFTPALYIRLKELYK